MYKRGLCKHIGRRYSIHEYELSTSWEGKGEMRKITERCYEHS